MLKATVLLEDVVSGQAAFHVWPGSHQLFHQYIQVWPAHCMHRFCVATNYIMYYLLFASRLATEPCSPQLHPDEIDGGFHNRLAEQVPHLATTVLKNAGYAFFHGVAARPDQPFEQPREFVGSAGDLILCERLIIRLDICHAYAVLQPS